MRYIFKIARILKYFSIDYQVDSYYLISILKYQFIDFYVILSKILEIKSNQNYNEEEICNAIRN